MGGHVCSTSHALLVALTGPESAASGLLAPWWCPLFPCTSHYPPKRGEHITTVPL